MRMLGVFGCLRRSKTHGSFRFLPFFGCAIFIALQPHFCVCGEESSTSDDFFYIQDDDYESTWEVVVPRTPDNCYDDNDLPQRCVPEFKNAASGLFIEATNTCGETARQEFCRQKESPGARTSCEVCDVMVPSRAHISRHMTDFNTPDNLTWWMSETMEEGIDRPGQVNLTLNFGKSFDISYVRLKFYTSRPESFAIYKRTTNDDEWTPYQYYSASCTETYGFPDGGFVIRENQTAALCTSEYSDVSPLTGGSVVFSTLEGRPSAYDFENSPELQEWVIATGIRVTLDKLNTFGDEIFQDPLVLKSYYYAISDFSVGARCRCYGHASDCITISGGYETVRLVCRCEHYTAGVDCEHCLPLFNDREWAPATNTDAHECRPCNCNGKSNRCFFDRELFDRTGHGGHCLDCEDNTEGVNCERCKPLHYRREVDQECAACNCDPVGSTGSQCAEDGQCPCKPGVGTRTCSRCAPNFYDMTHQGCRPCGCNAAGISQDIPCDPSLGDCPCKDNVMGQQCDRCKAGHFDLQLENEFGCVPCFCYGHTNQCTSAPGFYKRGIESTFDGGAEGWTAVDLRGRPVRVGYDADLQIISVRRQGGEFVYFLAPDSYLGNQRASYNHYLRFHLRIGAESPRISDHDIILEGGGLRVSLPITEQRNPKPSHRVQEYKFRLHEHPNFGWTPRLNAFDFIKILSNLTAIKIKATYTRVGVGYLDNVILDSAHRTPESEVATWIEHCSCPEGYAGVSCEQCAPGYRRDPPGDSPYSRCVKCFCHNHANDCEAETGRCICMHYTEGNNCERCATGYHGDARRGTPGDCKPCLCPDRGPCVVLPGGVVACQQCPMGSTGHQCDMCIDGYYGDPLGRFGPPRPCKKCECSDNIDPNAVGNCNTTTGQCLKCIYNTAGWNCERCLPGYFGDALAVPKGNCKRCLCHLPGTIIPERATNPCETTGGQCRCKANVVGRRCDRCRNGFWNIDSGDGCETCNCNRVGAVNQTCDVRSGQCHCRPGVTGRHCDQCAGYHYGFSEEGCKACDCDAEGSVSLQCDTLGQCQCRPNREGRNCKVCKDNKYSRGSVCIDCPPCYYDLLEKGIDKHKKNLTELANLLSHIGSHSDPVEDLDFQQKLREAMKKIDNLSDNAKKAASADRSLVSQLNNLRERIRQIQETAGRVTEKLGEGEEPRLHGLMNIKSAETVIQQAQDAAVSARRFLDNEVQDAYNSAVLRFQRLGQQSENLTKIARVAKELADQQQKDSEAIEAASNDALNTSTEAYRLAEEALRAQATMQQEVRDLTRRLDDLSNFMERTIHLANGTKREAGEAYDAALDIYADANSIIVPTADVQEKKDEAARIKSEASRIKGEADNLANKHKNMLSEIDDKTKDAQNLLDEAIRQQQITDELLTDTDAALAKAHSAIAAGERIIEDANETLTTLKGFDQEVQASKDKAAAALRKFPEVENMVTDAESKTREAQDALSGALQNATEARAYAQDAKRIAEQASEESDDVRKEADRTKAEAEKLGDQVKELADDIGDTDKRMKVFEDEADHDSGLAKEALEAAHEAQTSGGKASVKAREASKMLDDILDELDNLDVVDNSQLDDLERRLALAERELRNADLDAKATALREAQEEQQKWLKDYEDEIEQLRRDVANVAAIRRSLPEDCYRRLVLEP